MGRLGDELRSVADRADVSADIDTEAAARSVKRRRAARASGPAVVGMGAIAIVAVAVQPLFGGLSMGDESSADTMAEEVYVEGEVGPNSEESLPEEVTTDGGLGGETRLAEFYMCGSSLDWMEDGSAYTGIAITTIISSASVSPGATVDATVAAVNETIDLMPGARLVATDAGAAVLWNGYVVGVVAPEDVLVIGPADEASLAPDLPELAGSQTTEVEIPLVNCFDGAALPPGEYQVIGIHKSALDDGSGQDLGASFTSFSERVGLVIEGEAPADPFAPYF